MLRQLLTLFAVISGFTLVAEPVRAADADVVSMAQAVDQAACDAVSTRPLQATQTRVARVQLAKRPCSQPDFIVWVPTVQLRIDRAHE